MSERSTPIHPSTLGILGGMGPLASTAFLRTIYGFHLAEPEQGSPRCILYSDPTFPDRTAAIFAGSVEILSERLARAVEDLLAIGAERVVIACVTVHCVLPSLPEPLRRRVISLVDLTIDELLASGPGPYLLLATSGTRSARIFEGHDRWGSVADRIVVPEEPDQERLHALVYQLKAGGSAEGCLDWLAELRARSGAEGLVFGCTELHLLHDAIARRQTAIGRIIDPLWTAARDLPELLSRIP
jgi:aspartate racemase